MNVQFEGDKVILEKADFMKLINGVEIKTINVNNNCGGEFTTDINEVTNYLDKAGFKRNIKGFNFLRTAIITAINNPNILSRVTLELYPTIAKEFETTPNRAERAIRHSIERVYGNIKPCNSEFIALVADEIRLRKQGVER